MKFYITTLLFAILSISTLAQAQAVDTPYDIINHDDVNYNPYQTSALIADDTGYDLDVDQSGNKSVKFDEIEAPPVDPVTGEVAQRISDEVYCRGDILVSLANNVTSVYSFIGTGTSVYESITNATVLTKPGPLFSTAGLPLNQFKQVICSIPAQNVIPSFAMRVNYCESASRFIFQSGVIVIGRRMNVNVGQLDSLQSRCGQ